MWMLIDAEANKTWFVFVDTMLCIGCPRAPVHNPIKNQNRKETPVIKSIRSTTCRDYAVKIEWTCKSVRCITYTHASATRATRKVGPSCALTLSCEWSLDCVCVCIWDGTNALLFVASSNATRQWWRWWSQLLLEPLNRQMFFFVSISLCMHSFIHFWRVILHVFHYVLCASFMPQHMQQQQQQQQKCTGSHSFFYLVAHIHTFYIFIIAFGVLLFLFILSLVFSWWLSALTRWGHLCSIHVYNKNKRKHSNIKRQTISKLNKVCMHSEKKERRADNHALSPVPVLFGTITTAAEHHRMYHNGYAPNGT